MKVSIHSEIKKINMSRGSMLLAMPLLVLSGHAGAAPAGGDIVGGSGTISHSGAQTRIVQDTDRLAIDWDSFNVGTTERVQFVQPSSEATALNRILDNNPSQVMGRIDANGRVILANPNGLIFGSGSTINVQSLIASGLDIEVDDFMNGDTLFEGTTGSSGFVISRGLINAATGGNVALLGKRVENSGLISANLGHIALASGNKAVVTFEDDGLIGVSVPEATLAGEVGSDNALLNDGTLRATSGKILLTAAASEDLFSAAVNNGHLDGSVAATVHEDGSFSIGAGHAIRNNGKVDVSATTGSGLNAGHAILAGDSIVLQGRVEANAAGNNAAGNIHLKSQDRIYLGQNSHLRAESPETDSGLIQLEADNIAGTVGAVVKTDGNAVLVGHSSLTTPRVVSNHGLIGSSGVVRQRGYLRLDENLHVQGSGADIVLTHNGNRYGSLSISAVNGSHINVTQTAAPFTLNDIAMTDSELKLDARYWETPLTQPDDGTIALEGGRITLHASEIKLGNVVAKDAEFTANAGVRFTQAEGTAISTEGGLFVVRADNIVLGGNDSRTEIRGGDLNLHFRETIQTNSSISLIEENSVESNAGFFARLDRADHDVFTLTGSGEVDLAAQIEKLDAMRINLDHMVGDNARFFDTRILYVVQTGPVTLTDTLTWDIQLINLPHPENDFGSIEGPGSNQGYHNSGWLTVFDRNDVILKNIIAHPNDRDAIEIQAGGTITQAPDTIIDATVIRLKANSIEVGANGTSEFISRTNLSLGFSDRLHVNGRIKAGRGISIYGDEGDNTVIFGEHADSDPFLQNPVNNMSVFLNDGDDRLFVYGGNLRSLPYNEYWDPDYAQENGINMGEGNDQVHLHADIQIPIELGQGTDVVTVNRPGIDYGLSDFHIDTDVLVETFP